MEAYRRLSYLQGSALPRFYGSVQVEPSPIDRDFPEVYIHGIILEDVGGVDLSEYDPLMGDYTSLSHSLMAAVSTFPAHGVIHSDIRSHNIILSSDDRLVLIDFGNSVLRTDEATDEEWDEDTKFSEDITALQYLLHNRQIRPLSPLDTRRNVSLSFHHFNNVGLRNKPVDWLNKYYDDVPQSLADEGNCVDEVYRERWRLKPEVAAWIDSRPPAPHRYFLPRLGSPKSHIPKQPKWLAEE